MANDRDREGTAGAAADAVAETLRRAGIEAPRAEARLLVAHVLGVTAERVFGWPETPLEAAQRQRLADLVGRRAEREPMAHLLGRREFWGLPFAVTSAVLTPRPETETLIEALIDSFPDRARALSVLDLGTGSGCLLLAALTEYPAAWGLGVDRSPAALAVAAANARGLGLERRCVLIAADWGDALANVFDIVIANPPYIATAEIAALAPEVSRFEPRGALDGGDDGLDAYRRIAGQLGRLLAPGGRTFLEVGAGQAAAVGRLLESAGFRTRTRRDLAGVERCIIAAQSENFETS